MRQNSTADQNILLEIGARIANQRVRLSLTQAELSEQAGVSKRTIERMESGQSAQMSSFIRVLRAIGLLENLDALIPPAIPGPIEQLDSQGKQRQRASSARREDKQRHWVLGDEE